MRAIEERCDPLGDNGDELDRSEHDYDNSDRVLGSDKHHHTCVTVDLVALF